MARPNRFKQALHEPLNLGGLAASFAISAATLNPIPFLVGLALEAGYLLFVPDSKWYIGRLDRIYDNEVNARRKRMREELYPTLNRNDIRRFEGLEQIHSQIEQKSNGPEKDFFRNVLRRLDYLLEKYLHFAQKRLEFRNYLHSVYEESQGKRLSQPLLDGDKVRKRKEPPVVDLSARYDQDEEIREATCSVQEIYEAQISELRQKALEDENLHNQAIFQKRMEVLQRRSEHVGKIGETLTNIGHQMALMEDTFGLINDEIRTRTPEQVMADVDDVVHRSEVLIESLQGFSLFESLPIEQGADSLYEIR